MNEIVEIHSEEIMEPVEKPTAFQILLQARRKRVWDSFLRQVPVSEIAAKEGVKEQTIYNDLKECRTELKELLKKKNPFDFYIEHEELIKVLQRAAMEVALEPTLLLDVDQNTGKMTSTIPKNAQVRVKYFELILKMEQMLIDLRLDTGLMPRDAQKLVHTVEKMTNTEEKKEIESKSREQVQEELFKLLEKGRTV